MIVQAETEKIYKCERCGKEFTVQQKYSRHMEEHHKEDKRQGVKEKDKSLIPTWYLNPDDAEPMEIYGYLKSLPENDLRDKVARDIYRKIHVAKNRDLIEDYITNPESALYIEWVANSLSEIRHEVKTKEDIAKLQREKENLMDDIEEAKPVIFKLQQEINKLKKEIQDYKSEIDEYKKKLIRVRSFQPVTTLSQISTKLTNVINVEIPRKVMLKSSEEALTESLARVMQMKEDLDHPVAEITDDDVARLKSNIQKEYEALEESKPSKVLEKMIGIMEKKAKNDPYNDGKWIFWDEDYDKLKTGLNMLKNMIKA